MYIIERILMFGLLTLVWMICSGITQLLLLAACFISTSIVVFIASRMKIFRDKTTSNLRSILPIVVNPKTYLYFIWLIWEMIKSGLEVTKTIWSSDLKMKPVMSWVKASQNTEQGLALYANSITLTPGTVSVIANNDRIKVHSLTKNSLDSLNEGKMDKKITEFLKL